VRYFQRSFECLLVFVAGMFHCVINMKNFVKNTLKKYPLIFNFLVKCRWRLHIWRDWWGTTVWTKTTLVDTPLGFKLHSGLHPAYDMMRKGTFEIDETRVILRLLPRMDVFVDVGANLGYYSCLALKHGVHTLSFEPQQQNLNCLIDNFEVNGWKENFEIFPMALGEKPTVLSLYGVSGPSASLVKGWAGYNARNQKQVPVNCLDTFLNSRFADKRILIKIDVEGAEYSVLKGAIHTLARQVKPVWLLEVCFDEFHPNGINPDYAAIFQLFDSFGYQAYTAKIDPVRITLSQVSESMLSKTRLVDTFNYVFTKDDGLIGDLRPVPSNE
jgi:FkbM family methyltransferase